MASASGKFQTDLALQHKQVCIEQVGNRQQTVIVFIFYDLIIFSALFNGCLADFYFFIGS